MYVCMYVYVCVAVCVFAEVRMRCVRVCESAFCRGVCMFVYVCVCARARAPICVRVFVE